MHSLALAALACCTMSGSVHGPGGAPIANAKIVAVRSVPESTTSDAGGHFLLTLEPGEYTLRASANGYSQTDVGPIGVQKDVSVDILLEPSGSQQLRSIGEVRVDGRLALSRSVVPGVRISRSEMDARGNDRVMDALAEVPSVTFARPDGGASSAPSLVALRGPDPSETLIALDGQVLNDGNTGDLDVSRFPVAAFRAVDVSEGLGPQDRDGANTIGGAVNLLSLRPTREPHSSFSFSAGSFGRSEGWYNATGTHRRFGYAFAFDDQQEHGFVDQDVNMCANAACAGPLLAQHLGSSVSSRSGLAHLTWTFNDRADAALRIFAMGNNRDESGVVNTPADPAAQSAGDLFGGPGNALFSQAIRAYDLTAHSQLGAGRMTLDFAASNNSVGFSGGGISPYDGAHRDKRRTLSVQWGRAFENSEFSFGGMTQAESLLADGVNGIQHQTIGSYFVRGAAHPAPRLRLSGALYASHYSSFGSNLDARFGVSYDLNPASAMRFSAGTGFRAPLLIEHYVFPVADLPRDANCVATGQGNANLNPEHATEYELGYSRVIPGNANLDVALYRTNLRDPIENFYPLGAACPGPAVALTSYPVNVGNVVYQGAEVRFVKQFDHVYLRAQYGLNVAYPYNLPATVANPTTGANLVANAQFVHIPQQVGSLGIDWENLGWHGAFDAAFRGNNNELSRPPFTIFNAGFGKRLDQNLDLTLAFTNLTNEAAGRFTLIGAGVPYYGTIGMNGANQPVLGNLPTDRLSVEPFGVRFIVTVRK